MASAEGCLPCINKLSEVAVCVTRDVARVSYHNAVASQHVLQFKAEVADYRVVFMQRWRALHFNINDYVTHPGG